ncbi:MAG: hypothetical protein A2513_08335 [Sulfurimonas sp. RIFOXYD12_FULL_33_39]|uniref:EAL domain-containing protein n=1 Tax=unclassified Sulfurimonas TaxID=2623549 RepID=UPI0008CCCCD1|nr:MULTISPECIES: EAL domain-containing protein [unclassified Sulfurimonas]OHE10094.1 MAG: hypothetical protein A2513_08335 [Sulfurimonas sp. RIFOXYD12_FULL_33_39]OHE14685.1 MAG: hypothetical protein A2530_02145 [Sulfurimonas sp. RIFOXYD2_FULL_34_21]
MKLKNRVFALLFVILSLLLLCVHAFFNYEFHNSQEEHFKELSKSLHKLFESRLEEKQKVLNFALEQMLNIEHLPKAVFEKDYKKIDSIVEPYYKSLKTLNCNISILTFRDKENITLYRAHKPEFFGDALNEKREIILDTNNFKQSFSGFEVGNLEITYRITKPIFYENEYAGSVEIGLDPKSILSALDTIFKTDIKVAAKNSYLNVMLNKSAVYIGDRHFLHNGNEALEEYFLNKDKNLDSYKVDTSLVLKNHQLDKIGFLVVGFDFKENARQNREFMNKLFIAVTLFIAIFIIILFFVYKYFKKYSYSGYLKDLTDTDILNYKLLKKENFVPYFQPIVDRNGRIVKYEALMRIVNIQNNKEKILLPYEFLEKSIKNDLYIDILKDMVKKSLNFFSSREEKISINFLPDDLFNLIIMDELTESLKRFDSPNRVVVEISEKQCIDNFSKLLKIVKNLREIGVLISIDNFDGTYADNVHILVIKPDFIKIESTLIEKVSGSASLKNTLRNIIGFAKESGIKTVAESVEDEETFKLLKEYGVDEFQGYYFGYPIDLINKV